MNELLKRIFADIISRESDSLATDKYIDTKIQEIVDSYAEKVSDDEFEELRGLFYQVALIAEQEGFVLGMRYLLKIAISLLSDL
jgi:hypothetical protein